MRFCVLRGKEGERAAVVSGQRAISLAALAEATGMEIPHDLLSLIRQDAARRVGAALHQVDPAHPAWVPLPGAAGFGPPYRFPPKIWGIGLNYRAHAADLNERVPEQPASFMRPATTIIGPGDPIRLPAEVGRVTAEAELGVILGRRCRDLDPEQAPAAIFGYTLILDMTAEDVLRRNPRFLTRAKSFDTFFSFGPWVVTADEVPDPRQLVVETVVNGRVHAANTVANMTFDPYALVAFHSRVFTWLPGDVLSTGTPGAAPIRDGDVVGCRITGLGELSNPVVGPGAA